MPITTVVFDFDGVIANTEPLHLGSTQEAFATRGWTLDEADYYERYVGYDDRGLIVTYARDHRHALTDSDVETIMDAKMTAFSRYLSSPSVLFPGAKQAIEQIAARFNVGIASGALHHEIVAILTGAGLVDLFPVIVAADDVSTSKPSPEPYLTAAAKLGVLPSECLAIEDSLPGLDAARTAGMRTIAVATTFPAHLLGRADLVLAGLHEVTPELIAELGVKAAL